MRRIGGALFVLVFAAPWVIGLWLATSEGGTADLTHLWQTVLPAHLATTLVVALGTSLLATVMAVFAAFCVTFYELPGRSAVDVAMVLPLLLPGYLTAIVWRELLHGATWVRTDNALVLAVVLSVSLYPYVYLLVRVTFRRQAVILIEQALAVGVPRRATFRRVLLPLARPSVSLGAGLVFVTAVSDYGAADALAVDTVSTMVRRIWFSSFDGVLAMQVGLITAIFPLAAALLLWRMSGGGSMAVRTNRGRPPKPRTLSAIRGATLTALCLVPPVLGVFVPLIVLTDKAAGAFARLDLSGVVPQVANTLFLSLSAAMLAVALGAGTGLTLRYDSRRRWRGMVTGLMAMALAAPAMVLGFSALQLSSWGMVTAPGRWLADTVAVLLVTLVLRYAALAYFGVETGLRSIPVRMDEAARAVGRTQSRVFRKVLLPLASGGILAGGLLVFVAVAKELTLSLILQPFDYSALSLSAFHLAKVDALAESSVYALCLVLVLCYPVLSVQRWSREI